MHSSRGRSSISIPLLHLKVNPFDHRPISHTGAENTHVSHGPPIFHRKCTAVDFSVYHADGVDSRRRSHWRALTAAQVVVSLLAGVTASRKLQPLMKSLISFSVRATLKTAISSMRPSKACAPTPVLP
jgi:hypothetical protein